MHYDSTDQLPEGVRDNLPAHAQEIYLAAYNNAFDEYADPAKRRDGAGHEETARRVAWAAVENVYAKDSDGVWRSKDDLEDGR